MQTGNEDKKLTATLDELTRLKKIAEALAGADKETCMRMLHWASDKFVDCNLCHKAKYPAQKG